LSSSTTKIRCAIHTFFLPVIISKNYQENVKRRSQICSKLQEQIEIFFRMVCNNWRQKSNFYFEGDCKMKNPIVSTVRLVLSSLMLLSVLLISACATTPTTAPTTAAAPATNATAATAEVAVAAPTNTPASVLPQRGPGGRPGSTSTFASVAPTYADLAYANVSAAQKLDLYLPTTGNGPFPLVIMVHGGGFMMGDKSDGAGLTGVDALLSAGYAVASINYRLSGEAIYPAQIQDAKTAVRFLRANASQYNLDADHFAAWGASAGGNLVALLGTTCGVSELEGAELGYAETSSCVQAVVDWFGPIDFLKMDEQFSGTSCPQSHNDANSPESKLVGAAIQTVPDLVKTTNPMNYIDESDAFFFIEHGSADCNIPPIQGKLFAEALGSDKATYVLLDGAGHGGAQFETAENLQRVIDFLNQHLQ
jgi:acetyl esterase/lipase